MPRHPVAALALLFAITACSQHDTPFTAAPMDPLLGKSTVVDPTATFSFPLASAALRLKSDGLFSDGTYSVYAHGVCGVDAKVFATTEASNSGDAIMQTNNPKFSDRKCAAYPRKIRLDYPDGVSETIPVFMNVRQVQNALISIPIGSTERRGFAINPTQQTRCDQLLWASVRQGVQVDADSVLVERVAADTWHVQTQAAPNDRAYCAANGQSYSMPVEFIIKTSRPLP